MADKQTEIVNANAHEGEVSKIKPLESEIKNLIYVVRGKQVMLDSDLADLYQVETKVLNQAAKRNIARFPEKFRFQLTMKEYKCLKSQFVTSNEDDEKGRGGRRKLPYVFTEQGIAMLSAILRSDIAIQVSIKIMDAFIEMRKFLVNNSLMFQRLNEMEIRQLAYQKDTEEKFDRIFQYISEHDEPAPKIFFDGQIYDAFSLLVELVAKADKEIVLVDNYVDIGTLNILTKKKPDAEVVIYTVKKTRLSETDVNTFNQQYPKLEIRYTSVFHDRFLIIDNTYAYHIGASIKDAGKKCFGINLIEDSRIVKDILERLRLETEDAQGK